MRLYEIEFTKKYKEKITGLTGYVVAKVEYPENCELVHFQPEGVGYDKSPYKLYGTSPYYLEAIQEEN